MRGWQFIKWSENDVEITDDAPKGLFMFIYIMQDFFNNEIIMLCSMSVVILPLFTYKHYYSLCQGDFNKMVSSCDIKNV